MLETWHVANIFPLKASFKYQELEGDLTSSKARIISTLICNKKENNLNSSIAFITSLLDMLKVP